MLILIICVAAWIACGVVAAGFNFAYFQRKWPEQAERDSHSDFWDAILIGLFSGPVGLVVEVISPDCGRYGWTLRKPVSRH